MKKLCLLLCLVVVNISIFASGIDKETIAFQMNSCMFSIVSLEESQNLATYDKERDNLLNNISKEGMVKDKDITALRATILSSVNALRINEEERSVLEKIKTMEKNGRKWQAVSSALSSAMVFIPGQGGGSWGQAAFYTLVTAARTAADYGALKNTQSIEEAKILWELRKHDLENLNHLSENAFSRVGNIFRKYQLSDDFEVSPRDIKEFLSIITEKDAKKRLFQLLNNETKYKYLNEFYYYTGITYSELKQNEKANKYFDKYIANEKKSKIYKIDNYLGIIYLTKLSTQKGLSKDQYKSYADLAMKNLPHSGPAYIECAIIYYTYLQSPQKAVQILRNALYDNNLVDKESIILALSEWMPQIKKTSIYTEVYKEICQAIDINQDYVSVYSFLTLMNKCSESNMWDKINQLISITGHDGDKEIVGDGSFDIHLKKNLYVKTSNFFVFYENLEDTTLAVSEKNIGHIKGYSEEELKKKFDLFENYPELIPVFFDYDLFSKQFFVSKNLTEEDFVSLIRTPDKYEPLEKHTDKLKLTDDKDKEGKKWVKKVAEFCEEHQSETPKHRILVCNNKGKRISENKKHLFLDNYYKTTTKISSHNLKKLKLNPKEYYYYKYSCEISKKDGTSYRPRMLKKYPGEYIKIQLTCDKECTHSDKIYITYKIIDGKASIFSLQVGNIIRYKEPITTQKPILSKDKTNNTNNIKTTMKNIVGKGEEKIDSVKGKTKQVWDIITK